MPTRVVSLLVLRILLLLISFATSDDSMNMSKQQENTLEACIACEQLVESFLSGVKRTARNSYDGGDVAWQQKKLRSYANSELRLVEIQEELCQEVMHMRGQCLEFAEVWEEHLEKWWLEEQKTSPDLMTYLCRNTTKACEGWTMDEYGLWIDLDECQVLENPCAAGEFCVNTEGSYACRLCDLSCKTCHGDGPQMCNEYFNTNMRSDRSSVADFIMYAALALAPIFAFRRHPKLCIACGCAFLIYVILTY